MKSWFAIPLLILAAAPRVLAHAGHDHGGVAWPELRQLDAMAHRAEHLAEAKDAAALRQLAPALATGAEGIAKARLPREARNPLAARLFQDDLGDLAKVFADAADTADADLFDAAEGLHSVVAELMKAVGMPHVHDHDHGPNHGILVALADAGGKAAGYAEVKLHDDEGDLEVWLYEDDHGRRPLRRPLDTTLRLVAGERTVRLAVRDRETNPDEKGTPTIHEGATHYFVAGATEWLKGHVHIMSTLHVGEGDTALKSKEFELHGHDHDHKHGDDHGHGHGHGHNH